MSLRQQSTARVHWSSATQSSHALINQTAAFTRLAETELFINDQLRRSRSIMDFSHMQVLRSNAGNLVGFLGNAFSDSGIPRFAVLARAEHRGFHVNWLRGEPLSILSTGENNCRSTIADRRAHHTREGFSNHRRSEHV